MYYKQYLDFLYLLADKTSLAVQQCKKVDEKDTEKTCVGKGEGEKCTDKYGVSAIEALMNGRKIVRDGIASRGFGEIDIPACAGINEQSTNPFDLIQDPYEASRNPAFFGGGTSLR